MAKILVVDDEVVFCELLKTLTAWGSDALELQARKLGVTDFLSKSLSLDTIVASLQRGLMGPATAARLPRPPEEKTRALFGTLEADTILLVDNKPQTGEHLSRFLSQRGYQVHVAKDGPSVLELVGRVRPQLVVMDMELPGLKGLEVLRTLRAKKYTGGFVMMTGKEDDTLLKVAFDLGSADILGKPVDPERLLVAIQVGLILLRN